MPRHLRIHVPDLIYHVIARGNNGQPIFFSDESRCAFLNFLRVTRERYPFELYGYMLMPNHFHLLMKVGEASVSRIMQSILTAYSRHINRTQKRRGHLFQGRFKAILCDQDPYLLELVRYIHLNPVRARLAKHPDAWEWGSHSEYCGKSDRKMLDKGIVVDLFGYGLGGYRKYRRFIEEGMEKNMETRKDFYPGESSPFLGEAKREALKHINRSIDKERGTLKDIAAAIAQQAKVKNDALWSGDANHALSLVRKRFIAKAVQAGHQQSVIAAFLNRDQSWVSKIAKSPKNQV